MFDLVDRLLGFPGDLFQTYPDQDGTTDVVADDAGLATLTAFQASELLGFAMKLLDLPAHAARLLCDLRVILSEVVSDHIVRAPWRQHNPEQLHLMLFGKPPDLDQLAVGALSLSPRQRIYSSVGCSATGVIHLAIISERAVVNLVQALNVRHGVLGRIPGIHQDCPKLQLFLVDTIRKHVMHMVEFGLAVTFRRIDALVNDPELVERGIDIDTRHHPNPFDDAMRIPAVLPTYQFDLGREVLVHHGVIKDHIPFWRLHHMCFHVLPYQTGSNLVPGQIAVHRIMAELLGMLGKIGQRIVGLANQQVLTVVQASDRFVYRFLATVHFVQIG